MVDQKTCRVGNEPTVYNRVPICSLVKLPVYPNEGSTYDLVGWFFQYASESKCKTMLTTFLYQGYGDLPIINPQNLKSKCPISIRSDGDDYFVAITDCDIYMTVINYNSATTKYDVYSNLLSQTCFNKK